jgi:hypothetical protein
MGFELERAEGGGEDRSGREGNGLDISSTIFCGQRYRNWLLLDVMALQKCFSDDRIVDKG